MKMEEVLDFIKHFKGSEDTFLHGCCYWFAWILKTRFSGEKYMVDILYEPVVGHFVAKFVPLDDVYEWPNGIKFFDIRGDVSELYREKWLNKDMEDLGWLINGDNARYNKLMSDCRDFIDNDISH